MSKKIEDWTTEAVPMILNYQNDDSLFIPTAGGAKLKGLMVDAEHVLNIINNPDHNIKKLFILINKCSVAHFILNYIRILNLFGI